MPHNASISRRAIGSTDSEATEPVVRGIDVETKPRWLGRLDALLAAFLFLLSIGVVMFFAVFYSQTKEQALMIDPVWGRKLTPNDYDSSAVARAFDKAIKEASR